MLAVLGDSVTTDHISPAGSIKKDGPAGQYLVAHGVDPKDFNSYGARRGNHEVMVRGTFANVRLKNLLAPGTEGGVTRHLPDGAAMSIFDASEKYAAEKVPLLILAGKEYGSGSSRDWAAKGPRLLGVRFVIAESYERIHRSNLVGMGIVPLQFRAGESVASLGLTGEEVFETVGLPALLTSGFAGGRELTVRAKARRRHDQGDPHAGAHRYASGDQLLPARRDPALRASPVGRRSLVNASSPRLARPARRGQAARHMIEVVPGSSLFPARLQKKLAAIRRTNPGVRVLTGNYLHFVDVDGSLSAEESRVLGELLRYGPTPSTSGGKVTVASGRNLIVVPRLGTISPWSSKATDIAHVCGLARVRRIERGIIYVVVGEIADEGGIVRALADRMTEALLDRVGDGAKLFQQAAPRPLSRIALGADGAAALNAGQPIAGAGAVARRDRLPGRRVPHAGARPDRRRADDVRAGEQRALPPQDLQRRLRRRRRQAGTVAVPDDPAHDRGQPGRRAVGLPRQRRGHRRAGRRRASPPIPRRASTPRIARRCTS